MDTMQPQPANRHIINANVGMTNRIELTDINTTILSTFQDITNVLSDHCGPYGSFAMIASPTNKIAEPVFTKDGIGILRAMEYMSPMQEFVRSTLAYMGARIETAAGDGTTSSMIICSTGLQYLFKQLKKSRVPVSYTQLTATYDKFVQTVTSTLESVKHNYTDITAVTEEEAIYRVAYAQAYTSSHGNVELSDAVATLFSKTPKIAWNYLYIDKCKFETDTPYIVEIDDAQYTVNNVACWPTAALTDDLGTKRIRKGTTFITSAIAPGTGSYDGQTLLTRVEEAIKSGEDLSVLCPNSIDARTMSYLTDLFEQHPNHNVAFFLLNDPDPRLNDITAIKAILNDMELTSTYVGIDYTFAGGDLKINGLYPDTDGKLNPFVGQDTHVALNELISNIDKLIVQVKNEVSSRSINAELKKLQTLRMKLTVAKRTYFLIGGSAYDNATATDIVVDAILAVKHTLDKGYGLGGNRTLYSVLQQLIEEYKDQSSIEAILISMFCEAFCRGIKAVFKASTKYFAQPKLVFNPAVSLDLTKVYDGLGESTIEAFNDEYARPCDLPIIQPITADIEMVKRFGELALKFIKTCRIVALGGVHTGAENK